MLFVENFLLVLHACAQATLGCTSLHPDHIRERVRLRQNLSASTDLPVPTAYRAVNTHFIPCCGLQGHDVFATKWAIWAARVQIAIAGSDLI